MDKWYELSDPSTLATPTLLVYPDRVARNIDAAIRVAGDPRRLRPHVKTHKSADVVRMHLDRGIVRFKCATLREVQMLLEAGARDILLAYQPVGPAIEHLVSLVRAHRSATISCLADEPGIVDVLDLFAERAGVGLRVFLDLDVGMGRTGVKPGAEADALYERITSSRWIDAGGIHAYDGHSTDDDPARRRTTAAQARTTALSMRERLRERGFDVPEVVVGGTPPFAVHAADAPNDVILSPGTYVYHDWGYASRYPDLPFEAAALVLGRVISSRADGTFTIDIGSKAIAADPPQPRGVILGRSDAKAGRQSEEHWAWSTDPDSRPPVGEVVYLWPRHICPSVALHDAAHLVGEGGVIDGSWSIARDRAVRLGG